MTIVKPFVRCIDYWPTPIPQKCLDAYAEMIKEGQIKKHHVTYNHTTGTTMIEYLSNQPHEWVKQELRARAGR